MPEPKPGTVYLITNLVNRRMYVGKTHGTIKKRWNEHIKAAKNGNAMVICRAIRKHGSNNFFIKELDRADTAAELSLMEMSWIAELKTRAPKGYNSTDGGEGASGAIKSKKLRKEISDNTRRYFENHPEAKETIRAVVSAYFKTSKGKLQAKNHSKFMRERATDPKVRKQLRAGIKNAWKDPAFKKRMSLTRRKQFTAEVKDKIRRSLEKYRRSAEGKAQALEVSKKLKKSRNAPARRKAHSTTMKKYLKTEAGKEMMRRRSEILRSPEIRKKISITVRKRWKEGAFAKKR